MCLAGDVIVIAPCSLMQEVVGSSPSIVMTNIFVPEFAEFSEYIRENQMCQ